MNSIDDEQDQCNVRKKKKIVRENESNTTDNMTKSSGVKKSTNSVISKSEKTHEFEPVLEDILTQDVPLIEVYIGTVEDMRNMSKYLSDLSKSFAFSSLKHLKRVKKVDLMLCPISNGNPEDFLKEYGFNDIKNVRVISVAAFLPKTRKQYNKVNKIWPINNFRNDNYLEKRLSNTLFIESDKVKYRKYMRTAVEAANRSEVRVGAVIVDPKCGDVISVAGDHRNKHPLKHAVMVAIDLVARYHKGGAWDVESLDYCKSEKQFDDKNICDRNNAVISVDIPYLCTGYDIFVTSEPCVMCSMALLHSRIHRVFYGCSTKNGALGTVAKINVLKETNHRFEVYHGLLKDECDVLNHS